MILEILFVVVLLCGLCVIAYRGAIHEFQILQKEYSPSTDWSEPLSEQLPLVIRQLPKHFLGGWTASRTGNKQWSVVVKDGGRRKYRTTWSEWIQQPSDTQPVNMDEIASVAKLDDTIAHWSADGFRRWYMLAPQMPVPFVVPNTFVRGVQKTAAEHTVVVSTDGAPLSIWIAHEGAVPSQVVPLLSNKDPWTQTTESIPWISEVKYVEVKLRPGNAIVLPRHWYFAIRASAEAPTAWFWIAQFHTPISYVAGRRAGGL